MIRRKNVLKTSLQDILKSWRRLQNVFKTSWRCLEDVFERHLEDVLARRQLKMSWRRLQIVLKTSWRRLQNVKTFFQEVSKTSWRRMAKTNKLVLTKTFPEDVWLRRIYSSWSKRLEDVFWRRRRKTSSTRLQDVFIKMNICWVISRIKPFFYMTKMSKQKFKYLEKEKTFKVK